MYCYYGFSTVFAIFVFSFVSFTSSCLPFLLFRLHVVLCCVLAVIVFVQVFLPLVLILVRVVLAFSVFISSYPLRRRSFRTAIVVALVFLSSWSSWSSSLSSLLLLVVVVVVSSPLPPLLFLYYPVSPTNS